MTDGSEPSKSQIQVIMQAYDVMTSQLNNRHPIKKHFCRHQELSVSVYDYLPGTSGKIGRARKGQLATLIFAT